MAETDLEAERAVAELAASAPDPPPLPDDAEPVQVEVPTERPNVRAVDINGRTFDSSAYGDDWVLVYSAAGSRNFVGLSSFLRPLTDRLMTSRPHLKCVFIAIADLSIVPEQARPYVLPILKKIDSGNAAEAVTKFTKRHPDLFCSYDFVFLPDFSPGGDLLRTVGCANAQREYRVVVASAGKVLGAVGARSPADASERSSAVEAAWAEAATLEPRTVAPWPPAAGGDGGGGGSGGGEAPAEGSLLPALPLAPLARGCETIATRSSYKAEFVVEVRSDVGWMIAVGAPHSNVVLALYRLDSEEGEGEGEVGGRCQAVPPRKINCPPGRPSRTRTLLAPGRYEIEVVNDGRWRKKTVEFAVFATPAE